MIFEGDEPDDVTHVTYSQLMAKVCQIANALKAQGVKKGDVVTIYMPMSK
jgi:acetyl-CoA synthetase